MQLAPTRTCTAPTPPLSLPSPAHPERRPPALLPLGSPAAEPRGFHRPTGPCRTARTPKWAKSLPPSEPRPVFICRTTAATRIEQLAAPSRRLTGFDLHPRTGTQFDGGAGVNFRIPLVQPAFIPTAALLGRQRVSSDQPSVTAPVRADAVVSQVGQVDLLEPTALMKQRGGSTHPRPHGLDQLDLDH